MWTRHRNIGVQVSKVWFHNSLCKIEGKKNPVNHEVDQETLQAKWQKPVNAARKIMFPMECPTKLSLILLKVPDLETLSIFFFTKDTTSFASLSPISLKSPEVFSSLTSDIKHSTLGSIKSHSFRTCRRSRWCPYKSYASLIKVII